MYGKGTMRMASPEGPIRGEPPGQPTPPTCPKVVVALLNWNGIADTLECVDALGRLRYGNVEVLVVDNGSRGPEADEIEARWPGGKVIRNAQNLGYAAGNNVAIRHALKLNADYIWLLNNDTVVDPESLTALVEAAEASVGIGLLSPVIYNYANPKEIKFAGTVLDFAGEERVHLRSLEKGDTGERSTRLALWGTALLIRRQVVERIGLLDERYFAYVEDMDYSVRALEAGFGTRVVANAAVFHKESRSLGGVHSPVRAYLMVRNFYLFWRSHLTGWRRFTYPCRYVAWVLERALTAKQTGDAALADHVLCGAWDALHGHWGSWENRGRVPPAVRRFVDRWMLGWHPYLLIHLLRGQFRLIASEFANRLRPRRQTRR